MKLSYSQIDSFLKKPYENISLIVLFGPNNGLCHQRLSVLLENFGYDINDPFSTSIFKAEDFNSYSDRLSDEASSISFSGKKKLVLFKSNGALDNLTLKNISQMCCRRSNCFN